MEKCVKTNCEILFYFFQVASFQPMILQKKPTSVGI